MLHITTAVLIIDMQVGLIEGPPVAYRADATLKIIRQIIDSAHATDTLVCYVQDKDVGEVGSHSWQIHPSIAPTPRDLVLQKPWGDSFYETSLHNELSQCGVTQLVIVGMKTDVCVDLTSRRAVALGYDVILVADAHTTTDDETLTAPQIVAYHNDLLMDFGAYDGFGCGKHWIKVRPSHELSF